MGKYLISSFVVLFLLFNFVSCDGDGSNNVSTRTIGPEGGTIRSSDGRLTLDIPPGALSEETEITIRKVNPEDLGPEFEGFDPDLIYELEPDGLQFMLPVNVKVEIDIETTQDGDLVSADLPNFILLNRFEDIVEVLENQTQNTDLDTKISTITGELNHFSLMQVVNEIPDPGNVLVQEGNGPRIVFVFNELHCLVNVNESFDFRANLIFLIGNEANDSKIVFDINDVQVNDIHDEAISLEVISNGPISTREFRINQQYACLQPGTHKFKLKVSLPYEVEVAPGDFGIFLFDHEIEKEITCVGPDPEPSPPPPPQPTPMPTPEPTPMPTPQPTPAPTCAETAAGTYAPGCNITQDTLGISTNFGGLNFTINGLSITNTGNEGIMITTSPNLFTTNGTISRNAEGICEADTTGSGFLGGMPPEASNIIVKTEGITFSENASGNIVLEGTFRFNFPGFQQNSQSTVAECEGINLTE